MFDNENNYLDLLRRIMDEGNDRPDRTGVGARSIFGAQIRYDLRKGFPLLTTKKMTFKSISSELLWFIEGSGDERRLAEIRYGKPRAELDGKRTIWSDNAESSYWKPKAKFDGDLGKVYGQMWRKWPTPCGDAGLVATKPHHLEEPFIPSDSAKKGSYPEPTSSDLDGMVFTTNGGYQCRVLGKISKTGDKNSILLVEFDDGTRMSVSRPNLQNGMLTHPYVPIVRGQGCMGRISAEMGKRSYYQRAYTMWNNIMARCYDETHPNYSQYGGCGVNVSSDWKCFERFLQTLSDVPYFHEWARDEGSEFEIDKDYYGSETYSADTCMFLKGHENKGFGSPLRESPSGRMICSRKEAERIYGIPDSTLNHILQEKGELTVGENIISPYTPPKGYNVRPIRVVDQLAALIEGLKNDPFGRRHILSAWNPGELSQMALPPCHIMAQFYVGNGELSCMLYQRSADAFLGVPYNIASYALLTHMIAQICGYRVGEFVHTMGDTHIYHNHFDAVNEQLSRSPMSAPVIWLDPAVQTIDEFVMDSFDLIGYQSHDSIKAPMAV